MNAWDFVVIVGVVLVVTMGVRFALDRSEMPYPLKVGVAWVAGVAAGLLTARYIGAWPG